MKKIPDLGFWKLWNISFGFFGVQIAYALQSANISRIFSTLGADPHDLSYFWILPPLAGIIVQPIIGALSDRTWTRFGRRIPYLFVGALVAVCVMCLLPNAGSFGMSVSAAMIFGLVSLMFLDTSINMAMQPFKMMVGDMVNEKQKGLAYSIQSFLCNAGSLAGYLFPFIFAAIGISNIAPKGVVPDSVIYSFYIGAFILILCVLYTSAKVKEFPPEEYAEYHGITNEEKKERTNMFKLLLKAPKAFWTVGLVQFFCWAAFMFMWTYTNGTVALNVFDTPTVETMAEGTAKVVLDTQSIQYQNAADWVGILFAVQAIGSVIWAAVRGPQSAAPAMRLGPGRHRPVRCVQLPLPGPAPPGPEARPLPPGPGGLVAHPAPRGAGRVWAGLPGPPGGPACSGHHRLRRRPAPPAAPAGRACADPRRFLSHGGTDVHGPAAGGCHRPARCPGRGCGHPHRPGRSAGAPGRGAGRPVRHHHQ